MQHANPQAKTTKPVRNSYRIIEMVAIDYLVPPHFLLLCHGRPCNGSHHNYISMYLTSSVLMCHTNSEVQQYEKQTQETE